jgi:hypothetical protein
LEGEEGVVVGLQMLPQSLREEVVLGDALAQLHSSPYLLLPYLTFCMCRQDSVGVEVYQEIPPVLGGGVLVPMSQFYLLVQFQSHSPVQQPLQLQHQ